MIVDNESKIMPATMDSPEVQAAAMKVLVGPRQGWEDYVMRMVELGSGGYSPKHRHPWPHINYMVQGEGVLEIEGEVNDVREGSFAYVPADSEHQFRNTGTGQFRFICIVPREGHQ